jgi:hypothetical protein
MADWETVSSLATGAGTLVLAVATFAAVRSSNRSARIAELALQEQRRPLLVQSHLGVDPEQKIMFVDEHWVHVAGGHASAENADGNIYLVMSLRNVGAGVGVCQGWGVRAGLLRNNVEHFPEDALRAQTRDLYIPAGDIGLWQGRSATAAIPVTMRSLARSPGKSRSRSSSCTQTRSALSARSHASRSCRRVATMTTTAAG